MKSVKHIIIVLLCILSSSAKGYSDSYSRISGGYCNTTITSIGEDIILDGATFQYGYGIKAAQVIVPLFLEVGVSIMWSANSKQFQTDVSQIEISRQYSFIGNHIGACMVIPVANHIYIALFGGGLFRMNTVARTSIKETLTEGTNYNNSFSMLDKNYMGDYNQWKRFQIAGEYSIRGHIGHFSLEYRIIHDLVELTKGPLYQSTFTNCFSIGYTF